MIFDCTNCGECCGIVPIPQTTFRNHQDKLQRTILFFEYVDDQVYPMTDLMCCFLNKDKVCSIYKDRPEVCRLFGTVKKLQCPYYKVDGTKRTKREEMIERKRQAEAQKRFYGQNKKVEIAYPNGRIVKI